MPVIRSKKTLVFFPPGEEEDVINMPLAVWGFWFRVICLTEGGELNVSEIIELLEISTITFRKYLRILLDNRLAIWGLVNSKEKGCQPSVVLVLPIQYEESAIQSLKNEYQEVTTWL